MARDKTLIFTVNLKGYDDVTPYPFDDGSDRIIFTDDKDLSVPGWKTKVVKLKKDVDRQSRELKICVHKYVKGYDTYIYLDANMTVKVSLMDYKKQYFRGGLLLTAHNTRDCIFEEAKVIVNRGIDDAKTVNEQMRKYSMSGLRRRYGLFANGFFVRDNSVNAFCEKWFEEIKKHSYRDQLSLPYVMSVHKPNVMVLQSFSRDRFLKLSPHKKPRPSIFDKTKTPRPEAPKVWYFTPGRGDKNLGAAYNQHCEMVPEEDWICIRDGDTMFLNPYWPQQIEDIILEHGSNFPLISCVTNRLGLKNQLPYGFDNDPNILNHLERANYLFSTKYLEVTATHSETAGLFMLFPKKTWEKIKFKDGLVNGNVFIDYEFAHAVKTQLGRIGIAQGLYLFHLYRMGRPKSDISHLK